MRTSLYHHVFRVLQYALLAVKKVDGDGWLKGSLCWCRTGSKRFTSAWSKSQHQVSNMFVRPPREQQTSGLGTTFLGGQGSGTFSARLCLWYSFVELVRRWQWIQRTTTLRVPPAQQILLKRRRMEQTRSLRRLGWMMCPIEDVHSDSYAQWRICAHSDSRCFLWSVPEQRTYPNQELEKN